MIHQVIVLHTAQYLQLMPKQTKLLVLVISCSREGLKLLLLRLIAIFKPHLISVILATSL